ncbi:MAG: LysM peptidoglycan-binding domain-containing protein [Ardenticatenaceae bacterium]|nr:LysM peptidoglycan-binding domain-containing protein [Ardenticatenaceae bacterium]
MKNYLLLFVLLICACIPISAAETAVSDQPTSPLVLPTRPVEAPSTIAPPPSPIPAVELTAVTPDATTPPLPPSPTPSPDCVPRTDWPTYVIQPGDTLYNLARQTGSTIRDLQAANCIADPRLLAVGQVIALPQLPKPTPTQTPTPPPLPDTLTVNPTTLTQSGLVTFSWNMAGFQPGSDWAQLSWVFADIATNNPVPITTASGTLQTNVDVIPGGGLFTLQGTIAGQPFSYSVPATATCTFERLTGDPTLPAGICPRQAIQEEQTAVYQPFEHGLALYHNNINGYNTLLFLADHVAYGYNHAWQGNQPDPGQPPAGLYPPNGRFADLWQTYPTTREQLGWALDPAQTYTARWQIIANHVIITLPDGQTMRYLLYNGSQGEWIPIINN